jgi:hypothetical protein
MVEKYRSAQELVEAASEFIAIDSVDTRPEEQEKQYSLQAVNKKPRWRRGDVACSCPD